MNFEFSEMQQMLVDSAARLMQDQSGMEYWRERRTSADGSDAELWSQFAELGWLALAVPEDAGGLGGSMEDVALLMIELGRGLAVEPIVTSAILAARVIDGLATGEERAGLLGEIVAGEMRYALAHDEAEDRYELDTSRQTAARRTDAGYVLSGSKLLVLDAPAAHRFLVTATIAGEPGYGVFLVPADAAGLNLTAYPLVDGSRAADLDMRDVAVPDQALLGSGETAMAVLREAVDRASVALMAQAVGAMEAAITLTSDYARERRQFGQPIGKFQAVQHMAADAFVASYEARSALYQVLAGIDGPGPERSRAVAIARAVIAQAGQVVGRNGIQIHGGYGVTDEYAISHYYRRLFSLERQFGDAEYHLRNLSQLGQGPR